MSNGVTCGFSPLLIAFFRTFPGFTAAMYTAFSVVEFIGRSIGSAFSLVMGFLGEMLDYRWCVTLEVHHLSLRELFFYKNLK